MAVNPRENAENDRPFLCFMLYWKMEFECGVRGIVISKKIIIIVVILVLIVVNVLNIVRIGPNIMNVAAIIVCIICLALMLVDRMRNG